MEFPDGIYRLRVAQRMYFLSCDAVNIFVRSCKEKASGLAGAVSRELRVDETEGGASQLTLASLTVAGVPVTLTGAASQSYSVAMSPPGCTNSIMPIIISACWTGSTFSASYTNICADVPLGLEGYEIVSKAETSRWWSVGLASHDQCASGWENAGAWLDVWDSSFLLPCGLASNFTSRAELWTQGFGCLPSTHPVEWNWPDLTMSNYVAAVAWQPTRDLTLEEETYESEWSFETGDAHRNMIGRRSRGVIRFRAPFYYPPDTVVIFTLEGVSYAYGMGEEHDLTQVRLKWAGQWQDPVSTNQNHCSYVVTVTGGQEYEIGAGTLSWPATTTNVVESATSWWSTTTSNLTFTGFHNHGPLAVEIKTTAC